jgi:putative DNA primase/helicase
MALPARPLCGKISGAYTGIDEDEVRRALKVLADPEHAIELRGGLGWQSRVRPSTDIEGLVGCALELSTGKGVYFCLNPIPPGRNEPTTKKKVLRRRWLLIDCDAIREDTDSNSTEDEHDAAAAVARKVMDYLSDEGWPSPLLIDSGNGWHLLYRIDLPSEPTVQAILRRFLHEMHKQFSCPSVDIDRKVHNAARVSKLPGTWARKGPNTPERPHRICRLVGLPDPVEIVLLEQITAIAGVEIDQKTPVRPYRPFVGKVSLGDRRAAYGRRALELETDHVALAPKGERNDALNKAAFSLGQLVGADLLAEFLVIETLTSAAHRAGLNHAEIGPTIRSGLEAGKLQPRQMPEPTVNGHKPKGMDVPIQDDEPVIIRASQVEVKDIDWLWSNRIPLGKLTTFAGIGGLGKTFVLCDIAARISTGAPWPDCEGQRRKPGQTLFISGEDDPEDTLVPRLIESGADLTKIAFLTTKAQGQFTLVDLTLLWRAMQAVGEGLQFVAIDPPTAYLGGVDDHKNAELRQLLTPLKELAQNAHVSIVFNTHVTKPGGVKMEAMMRVMGSVAWVNAVRGAHLFARDPENHERRIFVPMKNNLGPERKGLSYQLAFEPDEMAHVEWMGEVDTTADQAANQDARRPRAIEARKWLIELFRTKRRWLADEFWAEAKMNGVSDHAIREARTKLPGIECARSVPPNGKIVYVWSVAEDWPFLEGRPDETAF